MYQVRKAGPEDAAGIREVLAEITAERVHSAIMVPWPVEEQRRYLAGLSEREAFHVAVDEDGRVLGYQALDLYSTVLPAMSHVGALGTFLRPGLRRMGIGQALFAATVAFARERGYAKFVIMVRASNAGALGFYRSLGFQECGRLGRQVRIDEVEEDEVILEWFL
ncbi:MAG: GNAT family N-acetyltransferase [Acidobacteria bacterium]|nr:GNAT family N-acetyltransferase [Acidobacteriota bacterium]